MPSGVDHAVISSDAQSTFAWRARDAEGAVCSGTMAAISADEVAVRIREEGRYVVSIRESASGTGDVISRDRREVRMKRDETIAFFRQVSVMLSAGVPISEALEAIVRQAGDNSGRVLLARIQEEVSKVQEHGGQGADCQSRQRG